jgi:hypothetical protein
MEGKRWETPSPLALRLIMSTPADCLLKLAGTHVQGSKNPPTFKDNKIQTMHVFLRGYKTVCEEDTN